MFTPVCKTASWHFNLKAIVLFQIKQAGVESQKTNKQ